MSPKSCRAAARIVDVFPVPTNSHLNNELENCHSKFPNDKLPGGPYNNKLGRSAPDNESFRTATTSFCSTTSSTFFGRLEITND